MMKINAVCVGLLASTLIIGCAETGPKEGAGTATGAVTGAVLGYGLGKGHRDKKAAIVLGTFLGGIAGQQIGKRLDEADRAMARQSLGYALEHNASGVSAPWRNPDSGNSGYAVPNRTYETAQGTPCREYTTKVVVGGREEQAYGTACRQADASWKVVN